MNRENRSLRISANTKTVIRSSLGHGIFLIMLACTRELNHSIVTIVARVLPRRAILRNTSKLTYFLMSIAEKDISASFAKAVIRSDTITRYVQLINNLRFKSYQHFMI